MVPDFSNFNTLSVAGLTPATTPAPAFGSNILDFLGKLTDKALPVYNAVQAQKMNEKSLDIQATKNRTQLVNPAVQESIDGGAGLSPQTKQLLIYSGVGVFALVGLYLLARSK